MAPLTPPAFDRLIRDGDTVATGGFVGIGFAEEIAIALEELYLSAEGEPPHGTGKPRNLTLVYAAGQGDGKDRGLDQVRPRGLGQTCDWRPLGIGAEAAATRHLQPDRSLQPAAGRDYPHVPRHRQPHRPGHITKVGIGTFVDPRNGGGKLNARTTEEIVEVVTLGGTECLFYKTFPVDMSEIIRATSGDADGNLTMEREALTLEVFGHSDGCTQFRVVSSSPR